MERQAKLINDLIALIMSIYLCWIMIPEHQRKAMAMKIASHIRKTSHQLAMKAGSLGMRRELANDHFSARIGYDFALRIMTGIHADAIKWYEKNRG